MRRTDPLLDERPPGRRPQRRRPARQSPNSAWTKVKPASAAVSLRNTRGPRPAEQTKGSFLRASSSDSAKPPSGPTRTAHGPGAAARSTSAAGGDAPMDGGAAHPAGEAGRTATEAGRAESGGPVQDDIETRAGLALLDEQGDIVLPVLDENGNEVQLSLRDALRDATAELEYAKPETFAAAVACQMKHGGM